MDEDTKVKKMTDCYFFLQDKCTKGDQCEFRHSEAAKKNDVVCTYWLAGRCARGATCHFRHPKGATQPLRPSPAIDRSKVPCFYYSVGQCAKGAACPFSHALTPDASAVANGNNGNQSAAEDSGAQAGQAEQVNHAKDMPISAGKASTSLGQERQNREEAPETRGISSGNFTQGHGGGAMTINFDEDEDLETSPLRPPKRNLRQEVGFRGRLSEGSDARNGRRSTLRERILEGGPPAKGEAATVHSRLAGVQHHDKSRAAGPRAASESASRAREGLAVGVAGRVLRETVGVQGRVPVRSAEKVEPRKAGVLSRLGGRGENKFVREVAAVRPVRTVLVPAPRQRDIKAPAESAIPRQMSQKEKEVLVRRQAKGAPLPAQTRQPRHAQEAVGVEDGVAQEQAEQQERRFGAAARQRWLELQQTKQKEQAAGEAPVIQEELKRKRESQGDKTGQGDRAKIRLRREPLRPMQEQQSEGCRQEVVEVSERLQGDNGVEEQEVGVIGEKQGGLDDVADKDWQGGEDGMDVGGGEGDLVEEGNEEEEELDEDAKFLKAMQDLEREAGGS